MHMQPIILFWGLNGIAQTIWFSQQNFRFSHVNCMHPKCFPGNQIYNGTQNSRKPIPPSMRTDQQLSPSSSSSSSSGLLADIDNVGSRRPRRESELEAAVQRLKDMSAVEPKGNGWKRILIIKLVKIIDYGSAFGLFIVSHTYVLFYELDICTKTRLNETKTSPKEFSSLRPRCPW